MPKFLPQLTQTRTFVFWLGMAMIVGSIRVPVLSAQTIARSNERGKEVIGTKAGTWRSATVFTHAIWKDMLFYGGGSGSDGGDPRHEIEIGVFHLDRKRAPEFARPNEQVSDGNEFGFHNPRNPIITRAQFGLDEPGKGITPLSILESNGTLYMFCYRQRRAAIEVEQLFRGDRLVAFEMPAQPRCVRHSQSRE